MKRYLSLLIMILLIPVVVSAKDGISCYGGKTFDVSECGKTCNFKCSGIKGTKVTFTHNEKDYSKYFKLGEDGYIDIVDKNIEFSSEFEVGIVVISDGKNTGVINIKNKAYVPTTTTTTTTTTADPNIKEVFVTLDPNNGDSTTQMSCKIAPGSDSCSITIPPLEVEGFNGWGKAKTCQTGSSGSFRIEKDITYYACYKEGTNTSTPNENTNGLYLESLEIYDKDKNEKIDYGTFSRKKAEYEIKVLNSVENLDIKAVAEDGIEVEITNNEALKVGDNEIIIKLTKDDISSIYKLKVTRLKVGETLSSEHYLRSLVIGGYEDKIKFNKEIFTYTLTVDKDVKKLEITVKTENENDTYEIKDNKDLVNGSSVLVVVTGEDGKTTTYTIKIIKKESNNLMLYGLIGAISLLIILLLVLLIIKKKNGTGKKTNETSKKSSNQKKDIEVLDI